MRYLTLALVALFSVLTAALAVAVPWTFPLFVILAALFGLGIWDMIQTRHSLLRNYPIIGHMRWVFEGMRPEIRQYLVESDQDEEPFSREDRSLVYQRAKGEEDKRPFGTTERVYDAGYSWLNHSIRAHHIEDSDFRVRIGGPECRQPYDASIYNISAMSFGALSANAISALNIGAKEGGFAHDTGEGGISKYHKHGGDLIYEIGTGYFGCRGADGRFDTERFKTQASNDQVRMIEVKLSQGAKPGHGGILPASKITPEIADARGVPMGVDCDSPPGHSAFSTPVELMEFIGHLREASGGKPVGFKLCIGLPREFMCIVKAMLETGIVPDFIVVDGKEGGTGAAPLEFANRIGTPLVEGLGLVDSTLRGAGLRDQIRIGASGKIITAFDVVKCCALGADWCNSARGFMFAIGCIQAQACHTNCCPVGVATQDPRRARALVVPDKARRVASFHANTLRAVADMVGAAGLAAPADLKPRHFNVRQRVGDSATGDALLPEVGMGCLVEESCENADLSLNWSRARANTFAPVHLDVES